MKIGKLLILGIDNMKWITLSTTLLATILTNRATAGKVAGFPYYAGIAGALVGGYIVGGIIERKVGE